MYQNRSIVFGHWSLALIIFIFIMYRFEKLRVYQNAMLLVEDIYEIVKLLPNEEKFALIDQLKRSTTSIVLNIAEGSGCLGDTEFKRFLKIALRSLYETVAGLKIAEKIFKLDIDLVLKRCETIGKELTALIKSLN